MNPVLAALMAESWAIDPRRLDALLAEINAVLSTGSKLETSAFFGMSDPAPAKLKVENGVATIPINGVIMKSVHPILKAFGFGGADLGEISALLMDAVIRDDVKAIQLSIDSPGGTVAGTKELADEVYATRGLKPITATASGNVASAAYWIGSQTDSISATASTVVGSIGVVGVMQDTSKAAEAQGVKVHVVSSGPLKGAGTDGAPVTDAHLADMQRHVNTMAGLFTADVARGRGMTPQQVDALATGQVWVGAEAKANGLVDSIAPVGVKQKEKAMEIEKLKAEIASLTAALAAKTSEGTDLASKLEAFTKKIAELEAAVSASNSAQRAMLLAKYEDRVAPANLAAITEYGDFCAANVAKFEAHLKSLPQVTRPARTSDAGTTPSDALAELSPAVLAVAKQMGNTVADIRKYGVAS